MNGSSMGITFNHEPLVFKMLRKHSHGWYQILTFNTLSPEQNGSHFPDDIFRFIFLNENVWIQIKIPLKFVHKGPINNIPALVQIMAWRRSGDKPLSEPMVDYWRIYASLGLNELDVHIRCHCNHIPTFSPKTFNSVTFYSHDAINRCIRFPFDCFVVHLLFAGV